MTKTTFTVKAKACEKGQFTSLRRRVHSCEFFHSVFNPLKKYLKTLEENSAYTLIPNAYNISHWTGGPPVASGY
jgi:uncharacterized FlgJ-related protein